MTTDKPTINWKNELELEKENEWFKMDSPPELIDQLYQRSWNKNHYPEDIICDSCKNASKCSPKAKKLALERGNDCHSVC